MQTLKTNELKLGDVVKAFDGPFGTAIVKQIENGLVYFFRPYAVTADFNYTGGVICYTGTEEFGRSLTDKQDWVVYQRKVLV